jgi:NADPH:quinone reductase-like Zn-dependent oxidoreductase
MSAAVFRSFGEPQDVIAVEQVEIPEVGADEVLVKTTLTSIHNHDLLLIRGEYGIKPHLPAIGGSEAVGVIAAAGSAVSDLAKGMRVAVGGANQTWAEYFVVKATLAVPVPEGMDDATAAQIISMPLGSVLALNQFDTRKGDWIVLNAANGAVGKVIAAAGRARGLNIALLVRRETARADLEKLGFGDIFVTEGRHWQDALRRTIGTARVAGGIDMIGGEATGEIASFISEDGLLLGFGAISNQPFMVDIADLIYKQITMRGYWSLKAFQQLRPDQVGDLVGEVFTLVTTGQLVLPVDQIFPLARGAEAVAASVASRNGKILIAA